MVVAVAGNVDHDEVVALVREHFGPRLVSGRKPQRPRTGAGRMTGRPTLHLVNRDAEQTHMSARRAHAGSPLGAPLGAVRAEQRARRRAEFPSVPTDPGVPRPGVLGVLDGRRVLRQRRAVGLRGVPARAVRRGGRGDRRRASDRCARRHHREECRIAKGSLRGGLVLGLEDSASRMNRLGRSELNYGEHRDLRRAWRGSTRSPSTRSTPSPVRC